MAIKSATIPANIPEPARKLSSVVRVLFKLSSAQANGLIEQGFVRVNGRSLRLGWKLCDVGDEVTVDIVPQAIVAPVKLPKKKSLAHKTIEFLYDDEDLAIVNKPANLLTVPTKYREPHTVLSLVDRRLSQQSGSRAYCVHRLDRGVSGVLVVAKSLEMAKKLRDQFAARKPNRKYISIVSGVPKPSTARLVNYLATDDDLNRFVVEDQTQGELAITDYQVQTAWDDAALLSVRLETGRRNQIRIQLAEIGHPILGDPRYRPRQATHWAWPHCRIALHAESLGFSHPRTGEPIYVETPWPQEFRDFQRLQRKP